MSWSGDLGMDWTVRGFVCGRSEIFFRFTKIDTASGAQPASYSTDPFVKWPDRDVRSPTSNLEVKNEWSYTPTFLICFIAGTALNLLSCVAQRRGYVLGNASLGDFVFVRTSQGALKTLKPGIDLASLWMKALPGTRFRNREVSSTISFTRGSKNSYHSRLCHSSLTETSLCGAWLYTNCIGFFIYINFDLNVCYILTDGHTAI